MPRRPLCHLPKVSRPAQTVSGAGIEFCGLGTPEVLQSHGLLGSRHSPRVGMPRREVVQELPSGEATGQQTLHRRPTTMTS